jgi:hypothetical protein
MTLWRAGEASMDGKGPSASHPNHLGRTTLQMIARPKAARKMATPSPEETASDRSASR